MLTYSIIYLKKGWFKIISVFLLIMIFVLIVIIEPRLYTNIYILSLIIIIGTINIFDYFLPIFNSDSQVNLFYLLSLTFLLPILLISMFIAALFNASKIIANEGRRLTNMLILMYGIFLIFEFWLINYQPYFLYHYKHGIISIYFNFIFWYFNIILVSQILYSLILSLLSRYKKPDYILILGSGLIGDQVPPLLKSRLNKGIELKNKFSQSKLIVSGGQGNDELISESEAMGNYLIDKGINESEIIFENQSTTTYENLLFSKEKVANEHTRNPHITIVSNNFHVLRAAFLSKKLGMKASVLGSHTAYYFYPNAFIREFIACIAMFKKTHICILGLATMTFIYYLIKG
ncbi:YdcF family protein [Mammaliicoccus vitulinus]